MNDPQPLKFDELGPIILNADGTMARIPNWIELCESERETAIRLISKRNARRKAELLDRHDSLPQPGQTGLLSPPLTSTHGLNSEQAILAIEDNEASHK